MPAPVKDTMSISMLIRQYGLNNVKSEHPALKKNIEEASKPMDDPSNWSKLSYSKSYSQVILLK